jgi:diadenosine tetraphosphatase ApaH/serine/threonine PP2A family protein phosphatase
MNIFWKIHPPHGDLPPGVGYSGPQTEWFWRCCRCGRFRIVGKLVEMYPPLGYKHAHGQSIWWHECLDCALTSMMNLAMAKSNAAVIEKKE